MGGLVGVVSAGAAYGRGRVAQWESIRFTRGGSLVRSQPCPCENPVKSRICGCPRDSASRFFSTTCCTPTESPDGERRASTHPMPFAAASCMEGRIGGRSRTARAPRRCGSARPVAPIVSLLEILDLLAQDRDNVPRKHDAAARMSRLDVDVLASDLVELLRHPDSAAIKVEISAMQPEKFATAHARAKGDVVERVEAVSRSFESAEQSLDLFLRERVNLSSLGSRRSNIHGGIVTNEALLNSEGERNLLCARETDRRLSSASLL